MSVRGAACYGSSLAVPDSLRPGPQQSCTESLSRVCCAMLSPGSSPLSRSFVHCGAAPPVLYPASCSRTLEWAPAQHAQALSSAHVDSAPPPRRLVQAECEPHAENLCYPRNQGRIVASLPLAEAFVVCLRCGSARPGCDGTRPGSGDQSSCAAACHSQVVDYATLGFFLSLHSCLHLDLVLAVPLSQTRDAEREQSRDRERACDSMRQRPRPDSLHSGPVLPPRSLSRLGAPALLPRAQVFCLSVPWPSSVTSEVMCSA